MRQKIRGKYLSYLFDLPCDGGTSTRARSCIKWEQLPSDKHLSRGLHQSLYEIEVIYLAALFISTANMAVNNAGSEKPEVIMIDELHKEETICDAEKSRQIYLIDDTRVLGLRNEDAEFYTSVTAKQRKRITRKVLFVYTFHTIHPRTKLKHRSTFVSYLCWLYCISSLT